MMKGYKVRLYPTKDQEKKIFDHFHAYRFVWNKLLTMQNEIRKDNRKAYITRYDMAKMISKMRNNPETSWLKNVSSSSMGYACADLDEAFQLFFHGKHGFPKFKKRKYNMLSYHARSHPLWFDGVYVHIEKVGKVKYKTDFDVPLGRDVMLYNARVKYVCGKYMLTFSMECDNQATELTDEKMGIDLGVKEFAVVAHGSNKLVFHNINKSKYMDRLNRRIAHTKRSIDRKYCEGNKHGGKWEKTNNILKMEAKLAKMQHRRSNIHQNYIHQVSHELVSMRPMQITIETLRVNNLVKNRHLSRAISEQCWGTFAKILQYKCDWSGITLNRANMFFPSTKTCSNCGSIKFVDLDERTYICPSCGIVIDRDYNAAINLMMYERSS